MMVIRTAPRGLPNLFRLIWHAPKLIRLFLRLFVDRRVPLYAKVVPLLGIAYLVAPIDIAFDWLFPIGLSDDLVINYLCLKLFIALCPKHVVRQHILQIEEGR